MESEQNELNSEKVSETQINSNENNIQISLNALDLANDESKAIVTDSSSPPVDPVMTKPMSAIKDNSSEPAKETDENEIKEKG